MKILVCAATNFELKRISEQFQNQDIDFAVTGIGPVFTTFNLTEILNQKKYDLVINIGICGAFSEWLQVGDCVNVMKEQFGDFGVTDHTDFQTVFDLKFLDKMDDPFAGGALWADMFYAAEIPLREASGLTVSNASGEAGQIEFRRKKFGANIETMEGAAVFYVCAQKKVPVVQIRCVSNRVEPRDTSAWNVPLALKNLSETLAIVIPLVLSVKNT
jgi:futalosine hydrolase